MNTVSILTPRYTLNDKWDLYYHLPTDNKWDLSSYTIILGNINFAEEILGLNESISEEIVVNCMLFFMRNGITPMWEDPKNRKGGCFSYKIINKHVNELWKNLICLCAGETLTNNKEHFKHINGITISPKKHFCILKIWLDTTDYQDPTFIKQILNLPIQGCLFKKHAPEF